MRINQLKKSLLSGFANDLLGKNKCGFLLVGVVFFLTNRIEAQVNFIRIWTATAPITDPNVLIARSLNDVKQTTQYYDALGRLTELVAKQGSLTTKTGGNVDLVALVSYDSLGREVAKYLPYAATSSDGSFKTDAFTAQPSFYNSGSSPVVNQGETGANAHTLVKFEVSPLGRPKVEMAPGNNWVGNLLGTQAGYYTNTAADSIRIFSVGNNGVGVFGTYTMQGLYSAGTLTKSVLTDESGHQTIEFKDKEGKLILKKAQSTSTDNGVGSGYSGWLCTYYIYDILNNLRCVVQPLGVSALVTNNWSFTAVPSLLKELCFRYEYDQRNRMVMKQVPGSGSIYMVYDVLDRIVMTQDSNLRSQSKWLVTVYDTLSRPVKTGLLTDATPFSTELSNAYNVTSYPATSSNFELLSQTYYDDYNSWVGSTGLSSSLISISSSNFVTSYNVGPAYAVPVAANYQTRGLMTGTMVKVLGSGSQYLYGVKFYDDRNRLIQVQQFNYTGGIDTVTTQYDFSGKALRMAVGHRNNSNTVQNHFILTKFNYDSLERAKSIWKNIDNASVDQLIDSVQYDNIGETKAKYLGTNVDSVIYDYNIRGWLLGINKSYVAGTANHYFGLELGYDKTTSSAPGNAYTSAQYNGNIAGVVWKTAGSVVNRKYDFVYDNVNRLTAANFGQYNGSNGFDLSAGIDFTANNLSYDANGNILTMNQKGFLLGGSSYIDQLTYSYQSNSNKLSQVADASNNPTSLLGDFHYTGTKGSYDYAYDGNGNLNIDNNKAIRYIHYNYLNLPDSIIFISKGYIKYAYDASGLKLQKTTVDSVAAKKTVTTYISGIVYQNSSAVSGSGTDTLQFIMHEEGRTRWAWHKYKNGSTAYKFEYDFFEKDHLGSTRMVLTQQLDTVVYTATMEAAFRNTESKLFANIANTNYAWASVPNSSSIPAATKTSVTNPNDSVSKVDYNGSTGQKSGPSLLLKVMGGDSVAIAVQAFYNTNNITTANSSFTDVLTSLASALAATSTGGAEGKVAGFSASGSPVYAGLTSFLANNDATPPAGYPKAYLNWMFLDDQFNYVSSSSGSVPACSGKPAATLNAISPGSTFRMPKNGYFYVWVSNETQGWDVFFDNLSVTHQPGPILEESHYYPFGLTMAGISDKALKSNYAENKYRYSGKELQNKEFSDGTGLEEYDFGQRMQDPQLGRFWSQDRFADKYISLSPYQYADNDPIKNIDVNGDSTWTTTSTVHNKDGSNTVTNTTHITGKVLDFSGVRKGAGGCSCGREAAGDLVAGINNTFNGQSTKDFDEQSNTTFVYNFDVQYSLANSMDDVSASDHLLVVVDDVTGNADPAMGGGPAGGISRDEGKIAYVQNSKNFDFTVENSVHEIGHNMGLEHVHDAANFMSYDQNRTFFNKTQVKTMYNESRFGRLNQGSNSQRSIQSTNNWLFHTSSNEEPYKKNTQVGNRIPAIINN